MEDWDLFVRFGLSLAIGFFIGLQREVSHGGEGRIIPAGERTFALLALAGSLAAMASDQFDQPFIFVGAFISIGLLLAISYYFKAKGQHVGLTTEVAVLITVLLGGLCYWGHLGLAVAVGIATTLILSIKWETDKLVQSLTPQDIQAALQFAVISVVVLPVLPNQSLLPAPFDVWNPFRIWLMVVFISGVSFLAYVLIKIGGARRGIGMTGLLGGLVSSTAVTLALAKRSNKKKVSRLLAYAIVLSWAVMIPRMLVQIGVINWALLAQSWLPLVVAGVVTFGFAFFLYAARPDIESEKVALKNPFSLMSALQFGALYAVILLISRSAQYYFGDAGILVSSFIAGFADVNAIVLGLSELSANGGLDLRIAALGIVISVITNTLSKGGIVLVSGSPTLKKAIWPGLILILIAGVVSIFLI